MARWAPALRMARRDLRRHPGRSLLVLLLVMLPITAATCVATLEHDRRWEGENAARQMLGGADALVTVSGYPRVRVLRSGEGLDLRPAAFTRRDGTRVPVHRDPASVDLATLLPAGSRSIPSAAYVPVRLATGGQVQALLVDAADPMTPGLGGLRGIGSGRVPTAPDEVAVPPAMADELGLLDGHGRLRPDATLATTTARLQVVGLTPRQRSEGLTLVAPPSSVLGRRTTPTQFLVDLPALGGPRLHALDRALQAHGVGLLPRDAFLHPRQWGNPYGPARVDASAAALGAIVVLLGLVEVVLLVGAAFAVGARRQVRELGLLAASGGSPADVRRVLLAQGVVVGCVGTALGTAAGLALNGTARSLYEWARGTTVWAHDVPWTAVVLIGVLGSLTGVAAALVPALTVGRLTPVAALDGSFPVRPGESRAHRAAFVLAASGLVLLVVGGLWTAREYDPLRASAAYRSPSGLPVALCGLAMLLLVAGSVWSAPYAVRLVARLGTRLPVSGRYAFRDASRHRFRTAAAAVALTVTVAGTLFAGFGTASASAEAERHRTGVAHSISLYLDDGSTTPATARVRQTVRTLRAVLGPVRVDLGGQAFADRSPAHYLAARAPGYAEPVGVLGARTLRLLVAEADQDRAVAALRHGEVVTTVRTLVHHGQVRLRVAGREATASRPHAGTVVRMSGGQLGDFFSTWVSPATARALGLRTRPVTLLATAGHAISSDDVTRLAVRGIRGWTPDVETAWITQLGRLVLAGAALVTLVVAGIAVALAAAEGRSDTATLAAVGAGPGRRRRMGAAHGLLLGLVGLLLGLVVGLPAGAAVLQVDGLPGLAVPWGLLAGVVLAVPALSALAGWAVTPSRLELVRRTG